MKEVIVEVPEKYVALFCLVDKLIMTDKQKTELKFRLASNKALTGTRCRIRSTMKTLKKMIA